MLGIAGEFIDAAKLAVGRQLSFYSAPKMIHGIEFRALPGQPEQSDVQCGCQKQTL
jgi:hypothetical protein